jgi:hypothetical protein
MADEFTVHAVVEEIRPGVFHAAVECRIADEIQFGVGIGTCSTFQQAMQAAADHATAMHLVVNSTVNTRPA